MNLPSLTDGASALPASIGITWHHLPHATTANWPGSEELVDGFACVGLLWRVATVEARSWAILPITSAVAHTPLTGTQLL